MMISRKTRRTIILLFAGFTSGVLLSPVYGQDHSGHTSPAQEETVDHGAHHDTHVPVSHDHGSDQPMQMQNMDSQMSENTGVGSLRDPHAYSGGYTRGEGPYSLPVSQQRQLADETVFAGLWIDRLETRQGRAEDFQEFQGEAWMGNSYQRLLLRTELEGRTQTIEESKTELLYQRALTPFWDLEIGARYDHGDLEHREWFALGVSGMAPYWVEISATAFASPEGHSAATIEAEYDLYLTQRFILQPRAELDFYGDSDLEAGHGKGLSKSLLGLRLRYDFDRQFSPYVGYERVHRHGETTRAFESFGQHREGQWIAGFRFWF